MINKGQRWPTSDSASVLAPLYLQTRQQPLRRHLAHDAVCREGKGKRETEVGQSWHINRLACNRARNWKVRTYANKSVDWKCLIILTKEKAVMNRLRERKENETTEKEARHIAFVWCNVTDAKKRGGEWVPEQNKLIEQHYMTDICTYRRWFTGWTTCSI